jgi:anti-sigma regulatory factor (Ser/Thr protein kinase)
MSLSMISRRSETRLRRRPTAERAHRFALAVHEIAANAVEHGGGTGELTPIQDDETSLYADVADHGPGTIAPGPYERPAAEAQRGRGLWRSQELSDSIQVAHGPDGAVVRVQMELDPTPPGGDLPHAV